MHNREIGLELSQELKKGYDVVRISRWVLRIYSENLRNLDSSTTDLLEAIFSMEDDPQFELSVKELHEIDENLVRQGKIEEINKKISVIKNEVHELDGDWLMCPLCQEAWESFSEEQIVICPKCGSIFHNPRTNSIGTKMKITKKEIGIKLKTLLEKSVVTEEISNLADELMNTSKVKIAPDVKNILETLAIMDAGPEFALSKKELEEVAIKLIHEAELEEMSKIDNQVKDKAQKIDEHWLMCPLCEETWESNSEIEFVRCPRCKGKLLNPKKK